MGATHPPPISLTAQLKMLQYFGALKSFVPGSGPRSTTPHTESWVCALHYRVTSLVFLVSCLLVCAVEYVANGFNISCIQAGIPDYWPIPAHVMNTYCYIMSTFTLPRHFPGKVDLSVHPGVGEYNGRNDEVEYKSYYQWVPFVLFLQACLFYTPHALFKQAEGGKVAAIISGLHEPGALLHEDERVNRTTALAKFFNSTLNTHNYWAIRMLLCELLFFVNVVFNIFLIDAFLGGEFSTYGLEVATFVGQDPQYRRDPMSRVFPRVTKCIYEKFGQSGTTETHDALCLLPINVVNEKIYVFLWFWLLLLALITSLFVVFRLVVFCNTSFLGGLIRRKLRHRHCAAAALRNVTKKFQLGDWRLFHLLLHNMNPLVFAEFVIELDLQAGKGSDGLTSDATENNTDSLQKPLLPSL